MTFSLWLIPLDNSPFTKSARELISDTVPRNFLKQEEIHNFSPHVPVASGISTGDKSPQQWLDQVDLPDFKPEKDEVLLELDEVSASQDKWRKMYITVKDNANLQKLADTCSKQGNGKTESPYFSLLDADVPAADVKAKVPLIEMKIGFAFGDLFACCGGALCLGSKLVLVDTSKPVGEWAPIASRDAPWAIWRATRNLI